MPTLNVSELNVVVAVLGAFTVIYGIISVKIKHAWYLGEARKYSPHNLVCHSFSANEAKSLP